MLQSRHPSAPQLGVQSFSFGQYLDLIAAQDFSPTLPPISTRLPLS